MPQHILYLHDSNPTSFVSYNHVWSTSVYWLILCLSHDPKIHAPVLGLKEFWNYISKVMSVVEDKVCIDIYDS